MQNSSYWTDFNAVIAPEVKLPKAPLELHPLNWYWDVTEPTHLTITAVSENADRVEAWLHSLPVTVSVNRATT
jgi:hypothetical protein